ncbi:MAG: transcription elongation factor GreA [Fimbriimonadales bacterium]|nr:MAG: transcription elongation factor GreA [Fimbriimonadales bacterium]
MMHFEPERIYLTEEGFKHLESELRRLQTVERMRIAEAFRAHKEHGEFSAEDTELESLKSDQAYVESRIQEIRGLLQSATIVREHDIPTEYVGIGSYVTVEDVNTGEQREFRIVGVTEADPEHHKLSYQAPIAHALIGYKVGDEVSVHLPKGEVRLRILAIRK